MTGRLNRCCADVLSDDFSIYLIRLFFHMLEALFVLGKERENFDTLVRIAEELAENTSVAFAGAVLRPHASLMRQEGELTQDGEAVLQAVQRAGYELVTTGAMNQETLEAISRPLIAEEELRAWYNRLA